MARITLVYLSMALAFQWPTRADGQAIAVRTADSVLRLRCEPIPALPRQEFQSTGLSVSRVASAHAIIATLSAQYFTYEREDGKPYIDGSQVIRREERVLRYGGAKGIRLTWASDAFGPGATLNSLALDTGIMTRVELATELGGSSQNPGPPYTDAVTIEQFRCRQASK